TIMVKANVNGVVVTKFVTIELTVTDMTDKTVMYSTMDNEIFFNEFNKEIVKVSLVDDGTIIYDASAEITTVVPEILQNTNSNDLTDYRTQVIVTFADGGLAKTNLVSYTKIINEDDDFKAFKGEAGQTIKGYFIMINDVELDGSWTGNTCPSSNGHTFGGIFDGQGHVAEIALDYYGIFGRISGATIMNTAFIVKQIGNVDFAYASILAYTIASSTVQDCYFAYDLPEGTTIDVSYYGWGQSSGLGIYANAGNQVKLTNVVVDTSKVEMVCETYAQPYAFGSLTAKAQHSFSGVGGGTWQPVTSNVYVLSSNKYLGYMASVSTSGNTINEFKGIKTAFFASNDITAYQDCVVTVDGKKVMLATTYRYDNMASALTAGESFSGLTSSSSALWSLDNNGELMFNGIALGNVEVNNFIANGVSEYAIVVPDKLALSKPSTALAYAVTDLHDFVSLATNGSVDLPIVKASQFNANTYSKYISVGNTGLMTADVSEVLATLGTDGIFYFSEGDNIFFTGNTEYGVAFGIYDFLRAYFGFEAVTDDVVIYNENIS
ncbi:MAG: hypothetical protein J6R83_01970, partial [Clostridia bacterium]|nr:hypothetical protein [Clostridia bacterium]